MYYIKVISSKDTESSLPNSPDILSLDKIGTMTNITQLKCLEKQYDDFIDKYSRILQLYDVIDKYLDIRDALTIRINKVLRERRLKIFAIE
jgi:hypothetical protein